MSPILRIGNRRIESKSVISASEETKLNFIIEQPEPLIVLLVAGEQVPLIVKGPYLVADPVWVEGKASVHLVGECVVSMSVAGASVLDATLERIPDRVRLSQYHWLLDWFLERISTSEIEDDQNRQYVWAEFAPNVPTPDEEDLMSMVLLWQRTAHGFRSIDRNPKSSIDRASEWLPVHQVRGSTSRRISARSISRRDPPRPIDRPTKGMVLVETHEEFSDTPENRYVRAVVEEFVRQLTKSLQSSSIDSELRVRGSAVVGELEGIGRRLARRGVGLGRRPAQSFLLRDNHSYSAVVLADNALRQYPSVSLRFPPADQLRAIPISPWSLNLLYERWITTMALEWIERRFGAFERPTVPSRGSWSVDLGYLKVTVRVDERYPKSGSNGVVCDRGSKDRPDLAIEFEDTDGVDVVVVDATWSQDPAKHYEKFQYALNLGDAGSVSPITNQTRRCVVSAGVAFPGGVVSVYEQRARLSECKISLPPSKDGEEKFYEWLDAVCPVEFE
jgi:hypothetical protein